MRTLAIGDIHGCLTALEALVEFVKLRDDDVLVTLGDYVNRGPNSKGVLDWLIDFHGSGRLIPLKGNHEIMMLSTRAGEAFMNSFIQVGGAHTLQSYCESGTSQTLDVVPERHWQFLERDLMSHHEIETHFFVHANAYPELPLDQQPDYMTYWEGFNDPPLHESGKVMVCGHSSQKSGLPIFNDNAICIDTWAHGGGWLSCLDAASRLIWQANQQGEVRKFFLDDL